MADEQYKTTLGDRVIDMGFTGGLTAGVSAIGAAITTKWIPSVSGFFNKHIVENLGKMPKIQNFASSRPILATAAVTGALGALYSLVTYSKKQDIEGADILIKALQEERASLAQAATATPEPQTAEAKPKPSHAEKVAASRAEASQRVSAL